MDSDLRIRSIPTLVASARGPVLTGLLREREGRSPETAGQTAAGYFEAGRFCRLNSSDLPRAIESVCHERPARCLREQDDLARVHGAVRERTVDRAQNRVRLAADEDLAGEVVGTESVERRKEGRHPAPNVRAGSRACRRARARTRNRAGDRASRRRSSGSPSSASAGCPPRCLTRIATLLESGSSAVKKSLRRPGDRLLDETLQAAKLAAAPPRGRRPGHGVRGPDLPRGRALASDGRRDGESAGRRRSFPSRTLSALLRDRNRIAGDAAPAELAPSVFRAARIAVRRAVRGRSLRPRAAALPPAGAASPGRARLPDAARRARATCGRSRALPADGASGPHRARSGEDHRRDRAALALEASQYAKYSSAAGAYSPRWTASRARRRSSSSAPARRLRRAVSFNVPSSRSYSLQREVAAAAAAFPGLTYLSYHAT